MRTSYTVTDKPVAYSQFRKSLAARSVVEVIAAFIGEPTNVDDHHTKQQCHIFFVYGSWLILLCGFIFFPMQGNILHAVL